MTIAAIMTRDLVDHPDRGDDRVEAEDDVEQHDLDDRPGDRGDAAGVALMLVALEAAVDLPRGLREEEEPADDEDDVAARERMAADLEERCGEADDPAQDEQQADAHPHRTDDPDPADEVAPTLRAACPRRSR